MKMKNRVIGMILVVIMTVMMLVGCSDTTDWDNVTKATPVAQVGDYEIKMDLVKYYYAEALAANDIGATLAGYASSDLFKEAATDIETQDVQYKACIDELMVFAALTEVAEEEGVAIDYDYAREVAYSELILATKNEDASMGAYFSQYLEAIKDNYTATDEALCDIAGELYRIRNSAEAVIHMYYSEGEYENDEDAAKDITKTLNSKIKELSCKRLYPKSKNVKVDVSAEVENLIQYLKY